jgi:hypothetical protein
MARLSAQQPRASLLAGWGRGHGASAPEASRLARWGISPVSRERTNECNGNNIARHGASGSTFDEVRRIASSIPRVPDNDRGNRNWRAVRQWAEIYSSEILRVFDATRSKTATMELLGLRSLGPFYTACLKEGHLDLVPRSYRARSKTRALPQQAESTGLGQQMAGLVLELKRTRKAVISLHKWLRRSGVPRTGRSGLTKT